MICHKYSKEFIVDIKFDTPSSAGHPTIFAQLSFEVP
jgi:hypothetical protein